MTRVEPWAVRRVARWAGPRVDEMDATTAGELVEMWVAVMAVLWAGERVGLRVGEMDT